jgi:hypothetical protein
MLQSQKNVDEKTKISIFDEKICVQILMCLSVITSRLALNNLNVFLSNEKLRNPSRIWTPLT